MKQEYEIQTRWTAFPLHPDTPKDGLSLEELFAGRSLDINQMRTLLKRVADELGLPYGDRKKTYNSRLAQELGKWAESKGSGDEFHNAVFQAYFVDGKNIGEIPELVHLAQSVRLPGEEAQKVLQTRAFKKAVDSDWSRAHTMGVNAVPTFVINQRAVMGAQPYEVLVQLMRVNKVRKRQTSR